MLLEIENLSKFYGDLCALKGVTVRVTEGCVGLLGPNGAGKSTLIRTLLGQLDFEEGSARILGLDIRRDTMAIRRCIGYMPEHEAAFPGMTGLEMVAYGAQLGGLPRHDAMSRAHEVIDFAGLGEERYRQVETYSTGMKQRVKLAQAVVHSPRFVLLDEPTNGLDPLGREEMLSLVGDLGRAGVNVILSSHLLNDVERVCDSLILMNEGQVVHSGTIAAFKGEAVRRIEVQVRGGIGPDGFRQALLDRELAIVAGDDSNRVLVDLSSEADLDVVWQVAVVGGCEVRHLAPKQVSLETAFLNFLEQGGNGKTATGRSDP